MGVMGSLERVPCRHEGWMANKSWPGMAGQKNGTDGKYGSHEERQERLILPRGDYKTLLSSD